MPVLLPLAVAKLLRLKNPVIGEAGRRGAGRYLRPEKQNGTRQGSRDERAQRREHLCDFDPYQGAVTSARR